MGEQRSFQTSTTPSSRKEEVFMEDITLHHCYHQICTGQARWCWVHFGCIHAVCGEMKEGCSALLWSDLFALLWSFDLIWSPRSFVPTEVAVLGSSGACWWQQRVTNEEWQMESDKLTQESGMVNQRKCRSSQTSGNTVGFWVNWAARGALRVGGCWSVRQEECWREGQCLLHRVPRVLGCCQAGSAPRHAGGTCSFQQVACPPQHLPQQQGSAASPQQTWRFVCMLPSRCWGKVLSLHLVLSGYTIFS